LLSTSIMKCC